MRPETIILLAALAGAALVLAAYTDESRRGQDIEIRHAWMDVVPQLCALVGVAGLVSARRRAGQAVRWLAVTNAAFTAMLTHATLVLITLADPAEGAWPKVEPALVIVGFVAFVFLILVATQRPMLRPSLVWLVRGIAVLGAVLTVWALLHVAIAPSVWRSIGAALAVIAIGLGVRLAQRLVPRRTRSG